jgi:hypothetical protein
MRRLLPTLLMPWIALAQPALAEDWYEVELIVFRHDGPAAGGTETWPADPGRPDVEAALPLREPAPGALLPLTRLEPNPARLANTYDALRRSPRYEPLGYWAWIQPGFERGTEPAVRIMLGEPPVAPSLPTDAQGFPLLGAASEAPPEKPPLSVPLDGVMKLGLSRYLYATLDLVFRPEGAQPRLLQPPRAPPVPTDAPDAAAASLPVEAAVEDAASGAGAAPPEFLGFRMTETRRLRSREIHYFDHPLFGAILLVTPRPMPDIRP